MKISPTESHIPSENRFSKSSKTVYFLPVILAFLFITAWTSNGDQISSTQKYIMF